ITDDRISDAILAAHARNVRVRILTDNDKSADVGSDVERFRAAGITVRRDVSEFHMHHKFAIFDDRRLLTGSYNWTRSAAAVNEENFILTTEPRLVRPFVRTFADLWTKFS
ncbi:MAG TPA: phospholipase D-like domain-containing protein, partial [Planctomycetia bacterium]|nr:phospholipase D-like domain-containing protein [Planctomycetia bacterium]